LNKMVGEKAELRAKGACIPGGRSRAKVSKDEFHFVAVEKILPMVEPTYESAPSGRRRKNGGKTDRASFLA